MKIAAVDIGTNSIRLLKGIINDDVLKVGNKKIASTRLGRGIGLSKDKCLSKESMINTCDVLQQWAYELKQWGVDEVSVIATSAVRDASNKLKFINMVKEYSGLDVDVIQGYEEAELGFLGVMLGVDDKDECMIIDVGGGSTELIVGDLFNGIYYAQSLDIGAVRMSEQFCYSDAIELENKNRLEEFIRCELIKYSSNLNTVAKNENRGLKSLIGIGGTTTSFAAIDLSMINYDRKLIQGHIINKNVFGQIQNKIAYMNIEQRKNIVGLQEQRADIIAAGGQIIYSTIEFFDFDKIIISDFDNLEGIFAKKYLNNFIKVEVDVHL